MLIWNIHESTQVERGCSNRLLQQQQHQQNEWEINKQGADLKKKVEFFYFIPL